MSFRNLAEPGGPGFSPAQVEVVAAEYKIKEPNDQGEMFERPGRPADHFPPPADHVSRPRTPPDLSVIAKARSYERGFPGFVVDMVTQYQEHGVDYIVALLKGYENAPPGGVTLPPGTFYNKYFPGHGIAMPPPLSDGRGRPTPTARRRRSISTRKDVVGLPDVGGRAASRSAQARWACR